MHLGTGTNAMADACIWGSVYSYLGWALMPQLTHPWALLVPMRPCTGGCSHSWADESASQLMHPSEVPSACAWTSASPHTNAPMLKHPHLGWSIHTWAWCTHTWVKAPWQGCSTHVWARAHCMAKAPCWSSLRGATVAAPCAAEVPAQREPPAQQSPRDLGAASPGRAGPAGARRRRRRWPRRGGRWGGRSAGAERCRGSGRSSRSRRSGGRRRGPAAAGTAAWSPGTAGAVAPAPGPAPPPAAAPVPPAPRAAPAWPPRGRGGRRHRAALLPGPSRRWGGGGTGPAARRLGRPRRLAPPRGRRDAESGGPVPSRLDAPAPRSPRRRGRAAPGSGRWLGSAGLLGTRLLHNALTFRWWFWKGVFSLIPPRPQPGRYLAVQSAQGVTLEYLTLGYVTLGTSSLEWLPKLWLVGSVILLNFLYNMTKIWQIIAFWICTVDGCI